MKSNRFRTFVYILKQSISNLARNKMMHLASLAIMIATMFIFGAFFALSKNIDFQMENIVQNEFEISAYLDPSITDKEADNFGKILTKDNRIERFVKVTKAEAYEDFKSNYPEEEFEFIFEDADKDFLSVSYKIKLKEVDDTTSVVSDLMEYSIGDIRNYKEVNPGPAGTVRKGTAEPTVAPTPTPKPSAEGTDIEAEDIEPEGDAKDAIWEIDEIDSLIRSIDDFSRIINIIFSIILLLLIFYSVVVISNTIMLTVLARKREIEIMRNIGATSSYIRWPFIIEGIIIGILGALVAFFLVKSAYNALAEKVITQLTNTAYFEIQLLEFSAIRNELLLYFILFSAFIGGLGATLSVNKHIKWKHN